MKSKGTAKATAKAAAKETTKGKKSKNGWALFLLILVGIVLGGFLGTLADGVSALKWLNFGQSFGLEKPLAVNIGILALTFGMTVEFTIASVIGVVLAIIIYCFL